MDSLDFEDFEGVKAPSKQGEVEPHLSTLALYLNTDVDEIPLSDLIDLYEAVKGRLPAHKLKDIDLAQELVLQFMRVKELQTETLGNMRVMANQKAQVANSVANILAQLTKMQTELHTAERFKAIEGLMLKYFKKMPVEIVEAFINDYEQL